ncbi:hypothetical protein GGF40_000071 [Coemansia sp. RSA 1286]|nr:hypothetical protein GGF39_000396 [Coemansia sp. RSA 1721]KAJ2640423.1 hypothetical protein GGF40_000071 [Coemansia sp. RSA 1286]
MDIPSNPQAGVSEKTWLVSIPLRPGACTVVDWVSSAVTEEKDDAQTEKQEHDSEPASESEDSNDDDDGGGGGYASGTTALPPAIANDPFFARLLKNAELRDAQDKKKAAKKRQSKRRPKDAVEDNYDLDDPFIDDSELTFMDGHNHAKTQQRKKRRKKDEGNVTETEGQKPDENIASESAAVEKKSKSNDQDEDDLAASALDDIDKYEDDDFFVYFGPLNEMIENSAEDDAFEAPTKKTRSRRPPEKKQPHQQQQNGASKDNPQSRRRSNGTTGTKPESSDQPARKKTDSKSQQTQQQSSISHEQQAAKAQSNGGKELSSATAAATTPAVASSVNNARAASQIPSNGRKSGSRTSRKIDQPAKTTTVSVSADPAVKASADSSSGWRPPVPDRDKKSSEQSVRSDLDKAPKAVATPAAVTSIVNESTALKPGYRRGGTPTVSGGASSLAIAPEDLQATNEARQPTPQIEAAIKELLQATKKEAFSNRQRFPSTLKPPLRQVCELSMARALEHDCSILELTTPEHQVFAWSTPMDVVGFTQGIYTRLAEILPYNRATVRKIVGKLLGNELINWKELQLKHIEEGLKARIDDQIERGLGWIPVGPRSSNKEDGDGSGGGAQVRWHWTTISKHILYQYMVLTLNINELRNHLDQGSGKDGSYREQQARKDAYAHLVSLWPGSSMSTYEISRAYSSRKTLLEKQTKRSEALPGQSQSHSGSNVQDQKASDRAESVAATAASKEDSPQQQHSGYRQSVAEAQDSTGLVFEDASFSASRQQPLEYSSPQTQPQFTSPVPALSPSQGAHSYHHQQAGFNGIIGSPSAQMDTQHPSPSSLRQSVLAEFSRDRTSDQDAQSHIQLPHRNLGFEARSPTQSLDQQVRSHVYSYYAGDIQNRQHQQQLQSQPQPQPQIQHQLSHQHQHQQPPQSQSPSAKDEDYASPNSSRYSMSVKNLTSP